MLVWSKGLPRRILIGRRPKITETVVISPINVLFKDYWSSGSNSVFPGHDRNLSNVRIKIYLHNKITSKLQSLLANVPIVQDVNFRKFANFALQQKERYTGTPLNLKKCIYTDVYRYQLTT